MSVSATEWPAAANACAVAAPMPAPAPVTTTVNTAPFSQWPLDSSRCEAVICYTGHGRRPARPTPDQGTAWPHGSAEGNHRREVLVDEHLGLGVALQVRGLNLNEWVHVHGH